MGVRIALCQIPATTGSVGTNLDRIMSTITLTKADVYIFPELFLTGYGADYVPLRNDVEFALDKLSLWCSENDIAIVVGAPSYIDGAIRNSLYFITQDKTVRYDKMYLAKFGIYCECMFVQGSKPAMGEFKGMKFGLTVCYDLFFPEITRFYALNGADVNICIAASAEPSKEYFEKITSTRSLENVTYTIFVNNVGKFGNTKMFGHSRLIGPLGNTLSEADNTEDIRCVYVDKDVIKNSRKIRRHMTDLRKDIDWRL